MIGSIRDIISIAIGAAGMLAVAWAYDAIIDDPAVAREARAQAIAEMQIRTQEAINEIQDKAERARAMRRLCTDDGGLFDFASGLCRKQ